MSQTQRLVTEYGPFLKCVQTLEIYSKAKNQTIHGRFNSSRLSNKPKRSTLGYTASFVDCDILISLFGYKY